MYRSFYQQLTFAWLPQATTVFFVAVFIAVLVRLYVLHRARDFDPTAALPLDDDRRES